jgi:class 3 adenylate cyclase/tetratricopeptide (TPR) repeat protein
MSGLCCARCGTENRDGRRFCAECGAALPAPCASCGFLNEGGEKFCGGCGAPLVATATAATRVAAVADALATEGERRPVTVLFADLVDYTRMSQQLDPEDVHALLERYYRVADEIVERYGGNVDKHIGDSVMAVFGAPIAHDDDGTRAVRAAAEIQRAMPGLSAQAEQPLAVHIGIAAGEVVASGMGGARHRAYTVIGNSVNLAARLLKLAGAGEIVLDDSVYASCHRLVRCTPIEGALVKGIDAPVKAWRFAALQDAEDRTGRRPFVGRHAELGQLAASLASCAAGGTGGTVFVRGDAGIGKSRLVGELRRQAEARGFECHAGLVLDFGMAKGRDAIRELVAGLVTLPPGADEGERHAALERAVARHPVLADRQRYLLDLLDLPQPADTRALYEAMDNPARQRGCAAAVVQLLEIASANNPLLLIVEDLHWADKVTLDCLAALTRAASTIPAVIALTSRVVGDPLDAGWRASVQGSAFITIDLGPLAIRDALALAGAFPDTPPDIAQKCVERAAGNPLFLEQLMRTAGEGDERLPASLSSLVLARMDRLPEHDRVALRAASIVGQRFPLELVRRLSELPDYRCDALVAQFLVRPEGDEFLFAHALIRDGVYASLTRARRAELHRMAADWYGERDLALRAEHFDRADAPEAPCAYLDAANAEAAALHPDRALALAERGAALAKDPADVVALNLLRGRLHCESGEGKPATEAFRTALAAAQGPVERCRALIGVAAGQRLVAGLDIALAALAEAEPLARDAGLTRELAELHQTRGNLHFARGDVTGCVAEHSTALRHAQALGDPAWEARALSGLADADYAVAKMRTAFQRFMRCVALSEAHGLTRVAIPNRIMAGHCRIYLMEFDAGVADMEASRVLACQLGDRHGEMFALESIGLLWAFCARYADAEPMLVRATALAEALGARRYHAALLATLAETLLAIGRREEAQMQNERALALSLETGIHFSGPLVFALKARMQDDAQERERCWAEGAALIADRSVGHSPIGFHRLAIDDALERGEFPRALAHADALELYTAAEPLPYTDLLIARGRALVGLAANPDDSALAAELARLRREAERVRWPLRWPDWALRGSRPVAN